MRKEMLAGAGRGEEQGTRDEEGVIALQRDDDDDDCICIDVQRDEYVVDTKRDGGAEAGEAGLIFKGKGKRSDGQEASKSDDDGRVGPEAGGGLEPR